MNGHDRPGAALPDRLAEAGGRPVAEDAFTPLDHAPVPRRVSLRAPKLKADPGTRRNPIRVEYLPGKARARLAATCRC